jgi:HEAT repeat protein
VLVTVLAAVAALAAPQPATQTQPASQTAFDQQRFNDLITLIEGQNSPQARRTGARELLRHGWPDAVPRLTAILRGPDRATKVAVALALADQPDRFVNDYLEPLLAMLSEPEAEVRRAAAAALAASPSDEVIPRLKALALDADEPRSTRVAALETLGMIPRRDAIAVLVEALADRTSPIAAAALATLEQATAQDFQQDFDAALAWWEQARTASLADWQRLQIRQLARRTHCTEQRVQDLEQRLAGALRQNYFRTPEAERSALVNMYLADPLAVVRRLGLELVQSALTEGKTLAPETATRVRELLTAPEPIVQVAAVRAVATLRDPADAERFERLLASEQQSVVREALINGLGYVGTTSAARPLLQLLESPDDALANEAITALGRLAERGVLDEQTHAAVAGALLARLEATAPEESAARERLLWAMSRVGDDRFAAKFVRALDAPGAGVRLAAVRGIAVMVDPRAVTPNGQTSQPASQTAGDASPGASELLDALVAVTNDSDVSVRRAAVETLAQFGLTDAHVEALWSHSSAERESDEGIRAAAWRGVTRMLAGRPLKEIEKWLGRLPADPAVANQAALELLQAAEKNRASQAERRAELGRIRAQIAARRVALNQLEPAIATYLTALEDLHAARSPETTRVALELLRLALTNDRYDAQLVAALPEGNPGLDSQRLWQGIREEIEKRLNPDEVDRAIAMLAALQTSPPTSMPAEAAPALQQLLQRARTVRAKADAARVKTALAKLRESPDDQPARQTIVRLGERAVAPLRAALRAALQAEQPDAAYVQQLHDLLKELVPNWPGFAPDAPREEKLKALETPPA